MSCFLIKDLSFSYPLSDKQVLNKINVQINQGEYVTICGKSGSGKSTLLRHLKSVLSPSGSLEGEIYFNGKLLKMWICGRSHPRVCPPKSGPSDCDG